MLERKIQEIFSIDIAETIMMKSKEYDLRSKGNIFSNKKIDSRTMAAPMKKMRLQVQNKSVSSEK